MLKIHILGGPGSGKTTLAQDLSSRLHIPHYDLDKVDWELENIIVAAEQPAWITEGVYLIWTDPLLYHADYIVLLEVSWPVAAWRIIHRHLSNSLRGTNPYTGINGVMALFKLLKDTRDYCLNQESAATEEATRMYLEEHGESAELADAERLLIRLEKYESVSLAPTVAFVRRYLEKYQEKVFIVKNTADRERLFALLASR